MPEPALAPPQRTPLETLDWAIYLACSWTWCIGMYLPVILVRDYGLWGWVAFAVPNVIGAAAVGFFHYRTPVSPGSPGTPGIPGIPAHTSGAPGGPTLLDRHRPVMYWFSAVTILFHIFFAGWMIRRLIGEWGLVLPFAAAALFYGLAERKHGGRRGSIIALGVSVAAAILWFLYPAASRGAVPVTPDSLRKLAYLAPGIAFGFLLCPHLDLTLQRARLANPPRLARRAFVLGFGLFFLLLITFSLCYAPAMVLVSVRGIPPGELVARPLCVVLAIHMSIQSALTVALHLRELPMCRLLATRPYEMTAGLLIVAVGLLWLHRPPPIWFGMDAGEVIYRIFLGFYGFVFPAYIWIAMIWRRHESPGPGPATLTVFALTVMAALPFFAIGFLGRQTPWILPGLALILAAPLALPRNKRGPTNAST